jgi:threonine/homoserine/homoserine lactone efflux protein
LIVLFDLTVIGLAITLQPVPLTAFMLVLASNGGVRKGAGFLFGWLVSLAIVITVTVLATGSKPPNLSPSPSVAVLSVKIAIGVGLLLIALRQYKRMGRPKKPKKIAKWQVGVDKMSPWHAAAVAALVQPWPLVAAAAAVVLRANRSSAETYVSLILFCLLATLSVLAMEIYSACRPDRSRTLLNHLRRWINLHMDRIIIILSLAVGVWLIGKSTYFLAT